jgi:hypothetical protein
MAGESQHSAWAIRQFSSILAIGCDLVAVALVATLCFSQGQDDFDTCERARILGEVRLKAWRIDREL